MRQLTGVREELYNCAVAWEKQARFDSRDYIPYSDMLEEILFHADTRFHEYVQYRDEGEFPARLMKWLENVHSDREKKILLSTVSLILFVDQKQMVALCQEAFKRIIVPWMSEDLISKQDMFSSDYNIKVRKLLNNYLLYCITDSFNFSRFINSNNLAGLKKPRTLGEDKSRIKAIITPLDQNMRGLIVLEDFVGTGGQSRRVLNEVRKLTPIDRRIIFIPLIMMEKGLKLFLEKNDSRNSNMYVKPVLIIPEADCLQKEGAEEEPQEFKKIRSLIKSTKTRVLKPFDSLDDPPKDPFGYRGSGALVVTCHNTPNNTIPLIHHRAPEWYALFRRVHHSKDGLR